MNTVAVFATIGGICGFDVSECEKADKLFGEVGFASKDHSGIYTQSGLLTREHYEKLLSRGDANVFAEMTVQEATSKMMNLMGQAAMKQQELWRNNAERQDVAEVMQEVPDREKCFYNSAYIEGLTQGQIYGLKRGRGLAIEQCWLMIVETLGRRFLIPLVDQAEWENDVFQPILPKEGRRAGRKSYVFRMPLIYFLARWKELGVMKTKMGEKLLSMGTAFSKSQSNVTYRTALSERQELLLIRGDACYRGVTVGAECKGFLTDSLERLKGCKLEVTEHGGHAQTDTRWDFNFAGVRSRLCLTVVLGKTAIVKTDFDGEWQSVRMDNGRTKLFLPLSENLRIVRTREGDKLEQC